MAEKIVAPNLWTKQTGVYLTEAEAPLESRFTIAPFTVLDARRWQKRKRMWIDTIGIKGEEGRASDVGKVANICSDKFNRGQATKDDAVITPGGGGANSVRRKSTKDLGRCFGQDLIKGENPNFNAAEEEEQAGNAGTSIFDPVLSELSYLWFAPKGGTVLDPFAGGSTRGIVAECLGLKYTGIELRQGQIDVNVEQAKAVCEKLDERRAGDYLVPFSNPNPTWICGDASELDLLLPFGEEYDMILSCPPYYYLEIYSSSEKDGSAFADYAAFMRWYEEIYRQAIARLKPNRFVVIVVGEVRARTEEPQSHFDNFPAHAEKGAYVNFEADTINMFRKLGLQFYNRAVLVTAVGSLPVRVDKQFNKYRKLGATHQMIYVFYKGNDFSTIPEELGLLHESQFGNKEHTDE